MPDSLDQPADVAIQKESTAIETLVGMKVRALRNQQELSLRTLAERSGLNVNTLSQIENSKTSPSIGTLQQLARALGVPLASFFESEPVSRRIVYTTHTQRPVGNFANAHLENLGKDLMGNAVQPFIVTLERGAGSGEREIVHTGHELVYCLSGEVLYRVEGEMYPLEPGDSIVFQSHLPHCWENRYPGESKIILVLYPADQHEEPGGRHFIPGD
jgi:transcriptional regulator with XRE-family HTH domain